MERLEQLTGLHYQVGALKPLYRTCLSARVEGVGQYEQDTDPAALVQIAIALCPTRWDEGCDLTIDPGLVSREDWEAALRAGLEQVLVNEAGLSGLEIQVLSAVWQGGGVQPGAFWQAASRAARAALETASSMVMEPWVHLTIGAPNDRIGAVIGDLGRRRARVRGTSSRGDVQLLDAEAPLAEVIRYATDLRSITGGIGSFTQAPLDYRAVPAS
ncbi:MAG: hypothetical protein VX938_10015 [Myxococcota bacterium]|nr:hypothetical protein [Myxococcota bacterium]